MPDDKDRNPKGNGPKGDGPKDRDPKGKGPGKGDKDGKGKDDGKKSKKEKKEDKLENFAINYGWSKAFLESVPELEELLKEAVKHTWSPSRFRAEIMDTGWYKKHSDTARQWSYLSQTDPATAQQRLRDQERGIRDLAGSLGLEVGNKQAEKWSQMALMHGWDENEIRNMLAKTVNIMGKNRVGGDLAVSLEQIRQKAYLNGVNVSRKTQQKWLREIVRGNSTTEEYQDYIKRMAIHRFPNLAQEINAGLDVMEIADPFRQTMAELLEMNPNQIDLNGKLMRQALSRRIPDNKDKGKEPQHRMMDMSDFEDAVRQDPRWMRTDNAKETMLDMGSSLLEMFGLTGSSG